MKNSKNGIFDWLRKNIYRWGARFFISIYDVILSEKSEYEQKKALSKCKDRDF